MCCSVPLLFSIFMCVYFSCRNHPNPPVSILGQDPHSMEPQPLQAQQEHIYRTELLQYKHTFTQLHKHQTTSPKFIHPVIRLMHSHNSVQTTLSPSTHHKTLCLERDFWMPQSLHSKPQLQQQRLLRRARLLYSTVKSTIKEISLPL